MDRFTISLNYVKAEKLQDIAPLFGFLTNNDKEDSLSQMKDILKPMTQGRLESNIHDKGVKCVRYKEERYYVVAQLKGDYISRELVKGYESDFDGKYHEFPKWGALLMREGDENIYFAILYENCSPNWNGDAIVLSIAPLAEISVPVISSVDGICKFDDNIIRLMRRASRPQYEDLLDPNGHSQVHIEDDRDGQHICVDGETLDEVFREIANKYQGWRDYRHTSSREYVIINATTNQKFQEWKETAQGLTSSFDKFYRGGIVD